MGEVYNKIELTNTFKDIDMRVLLINPPYDINKYMGKLSKMAFVFPPIGLTYIAGYLREKDIDVSIFDYQANDETIESVINNFNPDIFGITCQTSLVYSTIELSKRLKREFPEKKIIVGGVHASLRPQDLLKEESIDYVVNGEGEVTMFEFVEAIQSGSEPGKVPGVLYMGDGKISGGSPRAMTADLDTIPMPAIDLLPIHKYRVSPDMRTGDKVGVLITARGCPFNCIFCSSVLLTQRKYHMHSIERVCKEVERFIQDYGVNQLFIVDDNFGVNKRRSKELCREFIHRGFHKKITWWADARVDCVDEELLTLMKEAGCSIISYGVESGSQRLLDYIKKGITLEQVRETVRITKKVGIDIRATLILGLPTETREESLQTIEFAKELKIAQVRFALATPFPGTQLYDIAREEEGFTSDDWTSFSLMSGYVSDTPIYVPKGRDGKELTQLQRRANMYYFFKPRTIMVYLRRINSFSAFRDISLGALRFFWATYFRAK